jgi:Tetracyclin repressor-like, C-terminal domain
LIKGYRQIFDLPTAETAGKTGTAALRAMAVASRAYAKERPGLSAATFRCPMVESPEWMAAFTAVRRLLEKVFTECGLDDIAAAHASRILRSLVRGYVINEMSGSATASDFDESFDFAMDVFLGGLPALLRKPHCAKERRRDGALSALDFPASVRVAAITNSLEHIPQRLSSPTTSWNRSMISAPRKPFGLLAGMAATGQVVYFTHHRHLYAESPGWSSRR